MDESLQRLIHDAFPNDPLPARPITGHRCCECDKVDLLMGGNTWSSVAANFPTYCSDTYSLLTPSAKAFYLPAFMIGALTTNGIQGECLKIALANDSLEPAAFTPKQREAIGVWIIAYWTERDEDPPAEIINRWR